MHFNYAINKRQSKSCALTYFFSCEERLKYVFLKIFFFDSDSIITNHYLDFIIVLRSADIDYSTIRHSLHSIFHKVCKHLYHLFVINIYFRFFELIVEFHFNVFRNYNRINASFNQNTQIAFRIVYMAFPGKIK